MKILWLSHFIPFPPKGGAPQRSFNLLRWAAKRHHVTFLGLHRFSDLASDKARSKALAELRKFCDSAESFPQPSIKTRLHRLWTAARSVCLADPYEVLWLRSPELEEHLAELASRNLFDLIHVDTIGMVPFARLFQAASVVINHHNIESNMMRRRAEGESSWWKRHYFRQEATKLERLERVECSQHQMNLVVSPLDGERLERVCPDATISVVPNGVDTEYFQPRAPLGHGRGGLVFVGRLNWYPNEDAMKWFAREIWPALVRKDPDRKAMIVGKDPPAELVALEDARVTLPGYVDDVRPALDRASIYICPIRTGGGTRLKILDALAMAKPVVATGMSVEGLGLEDGIHYLRADTASEYVAQVRRLEDDAELRESLAKAGRRLVEREYSWEVVSSRLYEAYERAAIGADTRPSGA